MCCSKVLKGGFNMWILCSVECETSMRHTEICRHLWAQLHFTGPLVKWSIQVGNRMGGSGCYKDVESFCNNCSLLKFIRNSEYTRWHQLITKRQRKNATPFSLTNIYTATSVFNKSMQMWLKVVYTPELLESIALTKLYFVHSIPCALNASNIHISVKVVKLVQKKQVHIHFWKYPFFW